MRRLALLLAAAAMAAGAAPGNKPERLEWFRDQGFGLFIHWSVDSQIGSVISHSLVGASPDYVERFFTLLPRTFNPHRFDPHEWAVLAKLAGIRYVVFTAKHHSGFCMFDTRTTDYSIMNTPYGRDITGPLLQAFREQGIAPGLYYSPDDFHFLWKQGKVIDRSRKEVLPPGNAPLLAYDQAQIWELLTNYGKVDIMFLDGPPQGLREVCWELHPDIVVTRGAMETPEQYTPGVPLEGPWEGNLTMGTAWQYKPTHEEYKSGTQLISILIETRAKGGNLLLNIGPKPDGELPIEQEERLREFALWNLVNGESIYGVRPWVVTNEKNIWFTRRKDENTLYAFVTGEPRWRLGEWKELTLRSVKASAQSKVSILSQSDEVLEYKPDVVPKTTWRQDADGLHIRAMRAQRLYDDRRWPNAVVLKLTNVEPGMTPPAVTTVGARVEGGVAILEGSLGSLGKAASVEAGFQYRPRKGMTDLYEKTEPWRDAPFVIRSQTGVYTVRLEGLQAGQSYDYRAAVKHPLITIYGAEKAFTAK